uniref:Uncharacterized protein n=1 Tax=uncultured marine virus TaxID=186617 RepID=A0A0F7L9V9_9VIRU|nr:hypothetical protein [uncultured marine virus]
MVVTFNLISGFLTNGVLITTSSDINPKPAHTFLVVTCANVEVISNFETYDGSILDRLS